MPREKKTTKKLLCFFLIISEKKKQPESKTSRQKTIDRTQGKIHEIQKHIQSVGKMQKLNKY